MSSLKRDGRIEDSNGSVFVSEEMLESKQEEFDIEIYTDLRKEI